MISLGKISLISIITVIIFLLTPQLLLAVDRPAIEEVQRQEQARTEEKNLTGWLSETDKSQQYGAFREMFGPMDPNVASMIKAGRLQDVHKLILSGQSQPKGALGSLTSFSTAMFNPPASGIQYLAQIKDDFLGKPAYAQGIGYRGLAPILPIWRSFRNIIYVLCSLVFVIYGIMIMLRVKISPQAVVTIQNSIPRIITTLLLITFSYAVAGLLIDLSQFIQSSAIAMLYSTEGITDLSQNLTGVNKPFAELSNAGLGTVSSMTFNLLPKTALLAWTLIISGIAGIIAPPLGFAVGLLIPLFVGGLLLYWMFQFFFGCLKCYLTIILKIITAPFEIGLGAFPQSKMNFQSWIWDLIANISVFPISVIFLTLANYLVYMIQNNTLYGEMWAPTILSSGSFQSYALSFVTGGQLLSVGLGIAAVGLISKMPSAIPQYIFQIKPSPWGAAVGESLNFSKNPAVRFAKSSAANFAADELGGNPITPIGGAAQWALRRLGGARGGTRLQQAASGGVRNFSKQ